MSRVGGNGCSIRSAAGVSGGRVRNLLIVAAMLAGAVGAAAQTGGATDSAPGAALQQRLAAVKQSVAENQQRLHGYQWIETTQLMLKGENKPGSQSECKYGPDGKVQKTPMSAPQPSAPPSGGRRLKQMVIAKKKDEMKDYAEQVRKVLGMYVPPDPQRMQSAFQSQKVSMNAGTGELVFNDYSLPGDQMTIAFDPDSKKISGLNVKTYMDDPKDAVTLAVKFANLPDGTNYVQQTVLNAAAKEMQVTTTNSNYTPVGQ